jgi:hypothetical protein
MELLPPDNHDMSQGSKGDIAAACEEDDEGGE